MPDMPDPHSYDSRGYDSHMLNPPKPSVVSQMHQMPMPPLPPKSEFQQQPVPQPVFSPPRSAVPQSTVPPPPKAFVPPAPRMGMAPPVHATGAMPDFSSEVSPVLQGIKHDFSDLHKPQKKMPIPESLKDSALPELSLPESKPDKQRKEISGPVYVRVEAFRKILEDLVVIENDVKQSEAVMIRLNELKNEKDRQFLVWKDELEDIQRKLVFVDNTLFER
ncbi:hypothetical protein JW968_05755 [Candidatus Woesearchaeota archaeon]|nr:hypothetical protein [Candidatus Woesearchaeota archaeon]